MGGATATAFKLGMTVTRGWFWMRRRSCSVIYRGRSAMDVDLARPVAVVPCESDASNRDCEITISNSSHLPGSTTWYVVRRFNSSGREDRTAHAAAVVRMGADSRLAAPMPNEPVDLKAELITGGSIELSWFYCPLDQQAAPGAFRVYGDHGTGQMDWDGALGVLAYAGRRFYRWQTQPPDASRRFAIRAVTVAGAESRAACTELPEAAPVMPPTPVILGTDNG